MLFALALSAHAGDLSFTPWSGATVDVGSDGGVANVAFTTPLDGKAEGSLDVRASVPWNATGFGFGDYTLNVSTSFSNEKAVTGGMALDALAKQGLSRCLVQAAIRTYAAASLTADLNAPRVPKTFGESARYLERALAREEEAKKEEAEKNAKNLAKDKGPTNPTPAAAPAVIGVLAQLKETILKDDWYATTQGPCQIAEADQDSQAKLLGGYPAAREAANKLATSATTPFDEMATGELTRTAWSFGPALKTSFTTAEDQVTERPDLRLDAALSVYHPQGFALSAAAAPALDTQTGSMTGVFEVQAAWVSPAFARPAHGTDSVTRRALTGGSQTCDEKRDAGVGAAGAACTKDAENLTVAEALRPARATAASETSPATTTMSEGETASPAAPSVATDPEATGTPTAVATPSAAASTSSDDPPSNSWYFLVQAGWMGELGTTFTHTGRLLAGVRPTGDGVGIMAGVTYSSDATRPFEVVPTLSLSGELPDLGSKN